MLRSEGHFAVLYSQPGLTNFSVARKLGLCFLQEMKSFNEQQTLDAFGIDSRWRYVLNVDDQDAYLSRRSFVELRWQMAAKDPDMVIMCTIFEGISQSAIKKTQFIGIRLIQNEIVIQYPLWQKSYTFSQLENVSLEVVKDTNGETSPLVILIFNADRIIRAF